MTLDELLTEENEVNVIFEKKKNIFSDRSESSMENHGISQLAGRKRLISAIYNRLEREGHPVSKPKVKRYVERMYVAWDRGDSSADWIKPIEKKAVSLGFNPRKYKNQRPGDSMGMGGKGEPEYSGRAYFFVSFVSHAVNHFIKLEKKGKNNKK